MATRILVIAEAPADWRMVSHLIDRKTLHHAPDWLKDDPGTIDAHREWCGLEAGTSFTKLSQVKNLAKEEYRAALRGGGPLGFSPVELGGYEGAALRKILILALRVSGQSPNVIVYSRDMDRQFRERKASIESTISAIPNLPFPVVLALANAKREAWILNGFVAKNASEKKRLKSLRDDLKFDPCEKAENLDASTHGALKDAKRVLKVLTQDDPERESECMDGPWEVLRNRGKGTGLADFLGQVKDFIIPLVPGQ